MARIHSPRQRQSDKRWDYTVSSDEEGWAHAAGYCVGWEDPDDTNKRLKEKFGDHYLIQPEEAEKKRQHKDKYHSDGHATAEEAVKCHQQYELDMETKIFYRPDPQQLNKCAECGEWTGDLVEVGTFQRWHLCANHQDRATIEKHYLKRE